MLNWFLATFPELKEDESKKEGPGGQATAAEETAPASETAADLKLASGL